MKKIYKYLIYYLVIYLAVIFFSGIAAASTVMVNPDKAISIDGKPFFPIGAYCIGGDLPQNQEEWQEVSAWKLNLDASPFSPELGVPSLELCAKYNIYCYLSVGIANQYIKRDSNPITKLIYELRSSPYLFAYGLPDEPPVQGLNSSDMEWGYDIIKKADPDHPVILTYYKDFNLFKNSADIFILDFYPYQQGIPREKALYLFKDWYNRDSANVSPKPMWPLIQTFGSIEKPNFYFFIPTKEEIRAETYLAIVLGSKAILFYAYDCEPYNINNQPGMKIFVRNLTSELVEFSPIFLAQDSGKLSYKSEDVDALLKEVMGKLYLIAVNKNNRSTNVTFSISGISDANVTRIGKPEAGSKPGKTITIDEGKLTDTFGGLEASVYEITPLVRDLVITEIKVSGSNIFYTIKNEGTLIAKNISSGLYIDGVFKGDNNTNSLEPGESKTGSFSYEYACSNNSNILEVRADYLNQISELNETNNEKSIIYECAMPYGSFLVVFLSLSIISLIFFIIKIQKKINFYQRRL